jgi:hypothetical protein
MSRVNRRRQGHTEFRDNDNLDRRDIHGNILATRPLHVPKHVEDPFPKKKKSLKELLKEWDQEREEMGSSPKIDSGGGKDDSDDEEGTTTKNRKGGIERSDTVHKHDEEEDYGNSSLMINGNEAEKEEAPLNDMTCVGIDTCSARSISCLKEDFLDLELTWSDEAAGQLRGVGGNKGVSGKGCLVFYAKDTNGKVKAIIEPKGSYLEDPPAQFRILGQQRMKKLGVCATQDYDDAGTDIVKCKRSGSILSLTEGGGLLLLKTFTYQPNEKLKQQLRD